MDLWPRRQDLVVLWQLVLRREEEVRLPLSCGKRGLLDREQQVLEVPDHAVGSSPLVEHLGLRVEGHEVIGYPEAVRTCMRVVQGALGLRLVASG